MLYIEIALALVLLAVAAWDSYIILQPAEFGLRVRLGKRVPVKRGGVIYEGFHFKWPFLENVHTYSMELIDKDVEFVFTTQDELQLKVSGSFQYRLDPEVEDNEGRPVVAAVSEDTMFNGIKEAVQARLTGLGGSIGHKIFIEERQSLGDVINAILRLENPPHITHMHGAHGPDPLTDTWDPRTRWCGRNECTFTAEIHAKDLIKFYTFHWPQIRTLLKSEKNLRDSRSDIEKRYGLDVDSFALGDTTFTEETRKAMEKKAQTAARIAAGERRIGLMGTIKEKVPDATAQQVFDEAGVIVDGTPKTILSIQGKGGKNGLLAAALADVIAKPGGGSADAAPKKGKDKH